MSAPARRARHTADERARAAIVVAALGILTACADQGTISRTNTSDASVSVRSANGQISAIKPAGGVAIFTSACLQGPLMITYATGQEVRLDSRLCPGQELHVDDGQAKIIEQAHP